MRGFLNCVKAGFDEVGTKKIVAKTKIVWSAYSEEEVRAVGVAIERCLAEEGHMCPPLGAAFNVLREEQRVTRVSELVKALEDICA